MKTVNKSNLIISILIPLAVGSLSSLLSGNMTKYASLNQPFISPPGLLFPIVWTVLYILMGISSYLIYASDHPDRKNALKTYGLQLAFNFFWSILFFGASQYFLAFIWLAVMIILIAVMIYQFYRINPLAAYLQIPYLLWCLFAAVLNFMVYQLN